MIQNVRQQSAVNTACRISVRLLTNGWKYSVGSPCRACISAEEMKLLKNTDGITANSRAIPAVRPKEINKYLLTAPVSRLSQILISSLRASMASNGIVNSAITRIEATVRNLAYIGT